MSIRPVQDVRECVRRPSPSLSARVPRRLLRPTQPETTGVARELNGVMFTDVTTNELNRSLGVGYRNTYWHLREKFANKNVWDTLTSDVVEMMLNPPAHYDPDYHKQVIIAMLTCIKTLENRVVPV